MTTKKPLKIWSFWHQRISGSSFRCRDIARNHKKSRNPKIQKSRNPEIQNFIFFGKSKKPSKIRSFWHQRISGSSFSSEDICWNHFYIVQPHWFEWVAWPLWYTANLSENIYIAFYNVLYNSVNLVSWHWNWQELITPQCDNISFSSEKIRKHAHLPPKTSEGESGGGENIL